MQGSRSSRHDKLKWPEIDSSNTPPVLSNLSLALPQSPKSYTTKLLFHGLCVGLAIVTVLRLKESL